MAPAACAGPQSDSIVILTPAFILSFSFAGRGGTHHRPRLKPCPHPGPTILTPTQFSFSFHKRPNKRNRGQPWAIFLIFRQSSRRDQAPSSPFVYLYIICIFFIFVPFVFVHICILVFVFACGSVTPPIPLRSCSTLPAPIPGVRTPAQSRAAVAPYPSGQALP